MSNPTFQKPTDEALGFQSEYNFMRRMPLVYPLWLFKEVRNHIESVHGVSFIDYFKNLECCSEYNILGGYAYKYHRDKFHWIDVIENKNEWDVSCGAINCKQYSNRPKGQANRYIDLSKKGNAIERIFKKR